MSASALPGARQSVIADRIGRGVVVVFKSQQCSHCNFVLLQMRGVLGGGLHSQLLQQLAATENYWRSHEARSQASAASRGT